MDHDVWPGIFIHPDDGLFFPEVVVTAARNKDMAASSLPELFDYIGAEKPRTAGNDDTAMSPEVESRESRVTAWKSRVASQLPSPFGYFMNPVTRRATSSA
jgi:hypothetical protein